MYTLDDFIDRVENSNGLICYGAGNRFHEFKKWVSQTTIADKVLFCVDNNRDIQGSKINYNNHFLEIRPIEEISKYKNSNVVLLITNARYEKILPTLNELGLLDGLDFFCFTHIWGMIQDEKTMGKEIPENLRIVKRPIIPKIIHHCWFGRNPIPDKNKKWMESWRRFCPDYEIKLWNEDNYDVTKNDYMYEAYKSGKWGFVPDYARLDIIYQYGGIYLDTDVELIQSIDDLLYQNAFFGFESGNRINLGLGFGAVSKLQIIKEMRDFYDNIRFTNDDGTLNLTPSPKYQTKFLNDRGLKQNGEYQLIEGVTIYPEKMLCGKSGYTFRINTKPYTRSIHHYDASWKDEDYKKLQDMLANQSYVL